MKYMLMMHSPGSAPYQIASWPKKDIEAHIGFMIDFAKRLGAGGELVSAEGLAGPDQAKIIRAGVSDADISPLRLVADAFLVAERVATEEFHD